MVKCRFFEGISPAKNGIYPAIINLPCSIGESPSKDWDVTEILNKLMVKLEFLLADKILLTTSQCVALLSPFSPPSLVLVGDPSFFFAKCLTSCSLISPPRGHCLGCMATKKGAKYVVSSPKKPMGSGGMFNITGGLFGLVKGLWDAIDVLFSTAWFMEW